MPTENLSSNTEMVSFPRELTDDLAELIGTRARVCGGGACEIWEAICQGFGKPVEQHQSEVERLRAEIADSRDDELKGIKLWRERWSNENSKAGNLRAQLADLKRRHDGLRRDMATIAGREVPKGCTVADYAAAAIADALSASAAPKAKS